MGGSTVESVMTGDVVTVRIDTPFEEIARTLDAHHFSGVPVIDDVGLVAGVVSVADLLAKLEFDDGLPHTTVVSGATGRRMRKAHGLVASDVMTRPVIAIEATAPASVAARRLAEANVRRLFVFDGNDELCGVVTRSDLLTLLLDTPGASA